MTLAEQEMRIPDSKLAREITEMVRDTAPPLLFHHSSRVYFFGALAGTRLAISCAATASLKRMSRRFGRR